MESHQYLDHCLKLQCITSESRICFYLSSCRFVCISLWVCSCECRCLWGTQGSDPLNLELWSVVSCLSVCWDSNSGLLQEQYVLTLSHPFRPIFFNSTFIFILNYVYGGGMYTGLQESTALESQAIVILQHKNCESDPESLEELLIACGVTSPAP